MTNNIFPRCQSIVFLFPWPRPGFIFSKLLYCLKESTLREGILEAVAESMVFYHTDVLSSIPSLKLDLYN